MAVGDIWKMDIVYRWQDVQAVNVYYIEHVIEGDASLTMFDHLDNWIQSGTPNDLLEFQSNQVELECGFIVLHNGTPPQKTLGRRYTGKTGTASEDPLPTSNYVQMTHFAGPDNKPVRQGHHKYFGWGKFFQEDGRLSDQLTVPILNSLITGYTQLVNAGGEQYRQRMYSAKEEVWDDIVGARLETQIRTVRGRRSKYC